jgi:hypothetical protein
MSFRLPITILAMCALISGSLQSAEEVSFNYDIRPIMSDTCFLCHGPDETTREAGLRLDIREEAIAERDGEAAIIPGNAEDSLITWMINADDEEDIMPPPSHPRALTSEEKDLFRRWIDQGAKYEKHWSFISPEAEVPSDISDSDWLENPIDAFVLKRLDEEALGHAKEADKTTLIRRVTFDLTGLPPTLDEIDAFLADKRPDAYERLVDDLMNRVTHAERLTNEWMDVSRFSDSHGYSQDFIRDMSPYRDWVIEAFHENKPFDEFVEWQMAGDLLPNATRNQKLATAFLRLHPQNTEGGIVNEEFKVEYAAERVQTIGAAFMGMTMECSRCHDHKYDPISQKNFYELFSFFNNVDDSGQISYEPTDMPVPTMLLPTEEENSQLNALDRKIIQQEAQMVTIREGAASDYKDWQKSSDDYRADLSAEDALVAHFPLGRGDSTTAIFNDVDPDGKGSVLFGAQANIKEGPELIFKESPEGVGVEVNGDDAIYFPSANFFGRSTPFTVSVQATIPEAVQEGTLFHFNKAGILYNYKGWEVSLQDGHWDVRMAHTFPYNAIQLISEAPVKKDVWQTVLLAYDGSSKASGLKLYVDGEPVAMRVERDNLYKNILSNKPGVQKEIGLKLGARWRSKGVPGTVVDEVYVYDRRLSDLEIRYLAGEKTESESLEFYLGRHHEPYEETLAELAKLRQERNDLNEPVREIMIMEELPNPVQAYVLNRGAYDAKADPVSSQTPEAILPFKSEWPNNRLGLAKWLTDDENPLTARVTINRYWQLIFGRGLVGTPEDFGNQGQLPSHPDLLDWLAREFIDSDWNVRQMIKLMVTSATYKQDSRADADLLELDPENLFMARGPVVRLSAEMIRDNALAASGLLVNKVGGPSVYPYQPEGLWSMNKGTYESGTGEDLYRRSLYTIWKRTVPPPTMKNFDAPSRSYCVVKRQNTSSPLQALSLMNDPQFVEASRALAERVMKMSSSVDHRLQLTYRLLTSRNPSSREMFLIKDMYSKLHQSYQEENDRADELFSVGEYVPDEGLDKNQLAAHALTATMIMNLDASVVIR